MIKELLATVGLLTILASSPTKAEGTKLIGSLEAGTYLPTKNVSEYYPGGPIYGASLGLRDGNGSLVLKISSFETQGRKSSSDEGGFWSEDESYSENLGIKTIALVAGYDSKSGPNNTAYFTLEGGPLVGQVTETVNIGGGFFHILNWGSSEETSSRSEPMFGGIGGVGFVKELSDEAKFYAKAHGMLATTQESKAKIGGISASVGFEITF